MGGGLMQLVAYGAQDIYLTGNPQITFFKVVYRRHTNFSMETIKQTFNGNVASGSTVNATISRNGDLVHKLYLNSTSDNIVHGSAIIDNVELEIGGQRIDRHYQEWMNIWNELSTPESKAIALKSMQGDIGTSSVDGVKGMVQIPLQFWFCRNPGLALPLIALQYHEVKVKIKLGTVTGSLGAELVADYIYLDTDERRRFAQVSHEYLIEQLQKETFTSGTNKDYSLNFNHPVKELIWTSDRDYTSAQLKLNGHDRFSEQKQEYFMLRQPFDYHTAVPRQNLPTAAQLTSNYTKLELNSSLNYDGFANSAAPTDAGGPLPGVTAPSSSKDFILVLTSTDFSTVDGTTAVVTKPDGQAISASGAEATLTAASSAAATTIFTDGVADGKGAVLVPTTDALFWKQYIGKLIRVLGTGLRSEVSGSPTFADVVLNRVVDVTNATITAVGEILVNTSILYFSQNFFVLADNGTSTTLINGVKAYLPDSELPEQARTSKLTSRINVYSFSLKPEEHQPSGTCNFSRIDNAQLKITGTPMLGGDFNVYAVNYNVLRIMSGMGGLAYSN